MELLISRKTPHCPSILSSAKTQAALKDCLQNLLRHEDVLGTVEISLVLCDDDFIKSLNSAYRGKDASTDVLSFAQEEDSAAATLEGEALVLGDIVISLPTAERQAMKAQWDITSEVTLLTVHGLLHLLGYEDETSVGATTMQRKTAAALQESGVTSPVEGNHPFFVEYE